MTYSEINRRYKYCCHQRLAFELSYNNLIVGEILWRYCCELHEQLENYGLED